MTFMTMDKFNTKTYLIDIDIRTVQIELSVYYNKLRALDFDQLHVWKASCTRVVAPCEDFILAPSKSCPVLITLLVFTVTLTMRGWLNCLVLKRQVLNAWKWKC